MCERRGNATNESWVIQSEGIVLVTGVLTPVTLICRWCIHSSLLRFSHFNHSCDRSTFPPTMSEIQLPNSKWMSTQLYEVSQAITVSDPSVRFVKRFAKLPYISQSLDNVLGRSIRLSYSLDSPSRFLRCAVDLGSDTILPQPVHDSHRIQRKTTNYWLVEVRLLWPWLTCF